MRVPVLCRAPTALLALVLWACDSPVGHEPDGRGHLSLEVAADRAARLAAPDEYRVHLQGPLAAVRTGRPGETVVFEDLSPGSYTVALEGLVGPSVETYGELAGVTVAGGQNTDAIVPLRSFVPDLLTLPTFVEQGGVLDVRYTTVEGATSYRVDWDDDPEFGSPESDETGETSLGIRIDEAGVYFVRVSAVNRLGSVGRASSGEPVNVVDTRSDVAVEGVSAPATAPVGGSMDVTATTRNVGRGDAAAFRIGVYLSTNQTITTDDPLLGSCSVASLTAGAATTCTLSVAVPDQITPGTYWVGALADDEAALEEASESNNAAAAPAATVVRIEQPDLVVSDVAAPADAPAGSSMEVSATLLNTGDADAGAFRFGVYLSANQTITTDDVLLGSCALDGLDGGSSATCDLSATLPPSTAPGTYFVGAVADDLGAVAESDETNNTRASVGATVVSPAHRVELVITGVSAPAGATVGGPMDVTSEVANEGSVSSTGFRVGLYLSTDADVTAADVLLHACTVATVGPAGRVDCDATVTIPSATAPGTYFVGAVADDLGEVDESDETNNAGAAVNATVVDVLPDLRVSGVAAPTHATGGSDLQVDADVENAGSVPAGAFRIELYLSDDDDITAADTSLGSCDVATLDPGATTTCSVLATVPRSTPPGSYRVGAIADALGQVGEADEGNNVGAAPEETTVDGTIDLAAFGVTAPSTAVVGGKVSVSSNTANQGTVDAPGFRIGVYLSEDGAINPTDMLLDTCLVPSLDAGKTVTCNRDLTLPSTLAPGVYYLGVYADDQQHVTETSESNNDARAPNTTDVAPPTTDLVLADVTAPPTGTAGGTISITSITDNAGPWDAGAFRIGLYLSTDATIDVTDMFLDSCSVALLPSGASEACDRDVTIPGTVAPGTYYVGAIADDLEDVPEFNEANNALAASNATVLAAPGDLTVTSVSAPSSGETGGDLDITSTVANTGTADVGSFLVGLYLSPDANIDTGDVLVATCLMGSLTAGSTASCDQSVTVPLALPPGAWYVGAVADTQDDVVEADEGNNALAAPGTTDIKATPADLVVTDVTASADVPAGDSIAIRITVVNQGGTAAGPFRIGVYLSDDTSVTAGDVWLGACFNVVLAPGQAVDCSSPNVPVPAGVAPGTYYVGAIADETSVVTESDETNNALAASSSTVIH